MAGLGLGLGGTGHPRVSLPFSHPLQPLSQPLGHCSPSKGRQGHSGVGGPGEHKEKDDQQLNLGHFPLSLQPLPLSGGPDTALTGPESLESPSTGTKSKSDPALVAVKAAVRNAMGEAPWTWPFSPAQGALTLRKFSITSSQSTSLWFRCGGLPYPQTSRLSLKAPPQKPLSLETSPGAQVVLVSGHLTL